MEHFRDSDECSLRGLRGLCITTRDWGHHVVMPEGGRTRFSIDSPRHNTHHPHWFEFDTTIRPYLALTFDGSDDRTIFPQFTEMFRGESLEELRQLFIFGHSQSSRDRLLLPWQEIFKSAVNVDTMCASGSGAITFVKALSCTIDAAPEGEHGAAPGDGAGAPPAVTVSLFPKLRRLLVDEIECTPRGAINLRRELLTAKTLIKIMHSRKLRNMPLDTLGFRGCIFEREEEMDVLRAEITGSIVMDEPRFCFEDPSSYVDELHRYGISE
ncbi:hypothetical protein BC834DRAFT_372341 [Gloeopeniophorella convolvens]|nr:hypothetical protein BC834DRAFT_372341 [Gloeopeniophorella convolvens]